MDLKDIKAIIDLMKKNAISEFEMEKQDFKIRLKRTTNGVVPVVDEAAMLPYPAPVALPGPVHSGPGARGGADGLLEIKSPMIGTFYRAPSPEAGHYVEVGSEVGPDTVVCIIEAMKVMNEIKAEVRGVIAQISLDNARPVEYGQTLFRVRPI